MDDPLARAVLQAVHDAPRRWRMPPLPADARAAAAADTETALAFAIEAARVASLQGADPPHELRDGFTTKLADWIRAALDPAAGDAAFKALVLRVHDDDVREHFRLATQAAADRRAVRTAVDAIAHPGKLRAMEPSPQRSRLAELHRRAIEGEWAQLRAEAEAFGMDDIASSPALARLERGEALMRVPSVARYVALCSERGPVAGSDAASAQGRESARIGNVAEHETVAVFERIAAALPGFRVARSLRTPAAFPGDAGKAKDEWDAALLHDASGAARIVLLAEVKASPAAAVPDFSRLHRGLQRLASADPREVYAFPSSHGNVRVAGESLRALAPQGRDLPDCVIYCSTAPAEARPPVLAAASKAVLLAEPKSLAFANAIAHGGSPAPGELASVWDSLATEPRLRAVLHQYDTGRAVLAAMLHPQDLWAAFSARGRAA